MKSFGQMLKEARIKKGLSLREAADKLGISFGYLGSIERGGPVGNISLQEFSSLLNIPLHLIAKAASARKGSFPLKIQPADPESKVTLAAKLSEIWPHMEESEVLMLRNALDLLYEE